MPQIYCAIDTPDLARAVQLSQMVSSSGCGIKLGLEFFSAHGIKGVETIQSACPGIPIFLDLKFHDIPNTVAGAMRAIARLGVTYVNVHASGGREMMIAAKEALLKESEKIGLFPPKLIAVTVLTSLDDDNLKSVGQNGPVEHQAMRLALLAYECGLSGVVCSAHEIAMLRHRLGQDFVLMVPGIRPAGSSTGDQKRVMTPPEAMKAGASHLVIGRPITEADNPAEAARVILKSLEITSF